jgi:hypothetical protein
MLEIHVPGSSVEIVAKGAPKALPGGKPSFTALEADATLLVRIRNTVYGAKGYRARRTKHQAPRTKRQSTGQAPAT